MPRRSTGAALAELLVVMLGFAPLALGALQIALIYNAKAVLNYATFEAARTGAVSNARRDPMRAALARHLAPLYGGGTDAGAIMASQGRALADVFTPVLPGTPLGAGTRIEILSPTREAFDDFAVEINGERQLPNDHLKYRPRTVGTQSGVNIQDANLLKIRVTYGYKLFVPVINRLVAASLRVIDPANRNYYDADPPRLPIVATATVRMHSPALPDGNASSPGAGAGGAPPRPPGATPPEGGGGQPPCTVINCSAPNPSPAPDPVAGQDPCTDGNCGDGDPQMCPLPPRTGQNSGALPSGGTLSELLSGTGQAPAAQATGIAASAGNPINVVTGNKYQREVDLNPLPGSLGLEFVRHYNSRSRHPSPLGYGWSHSYFANLRQHRSGAWILRQADGRDIVFRPRGESAVRYESILPNDGYLTADRDRGHTWYWPSGRRLRFDPQGRLYRVETAAGEALTLTYDREGRLLQVSDPQARTLRLAYYPNGRIKSLSDPSGARFEYTYDHAGNLWHVRGPEGAARTYHYEDPNDPHNLTGLTDGRGVRLATWAYDAQDRAVLSTHADGVGRVTLEYAPGRTLVRDSRGQASVYHTDVRHGIPLVTRLDGSGCAACRLADVAYAYNDRLQRIETRTGEVAVAHAYDARGRLRQSVRRAGAQQELIARYEYAHDTFHPTLIARPSVAPGKERTVRIRYNVHGQPLHLRDSGYRPDGTGRYHPIERTLAVTYENGRPVAIDGPLPGSADTLRYAYDAQNRLVEIHAPEGLRTRIEAFDAYGRPLRVRDPNGVVTAYRYNAHGQPVEIHKGTLRYRVAYDAEGRPVSLAKPDGTFVVAEYDAAGRLQSVRDNAGHRLEWQRDTEDNVLAITARAATGEVLAWRGAEYDLKNRVTAVRDATGVRTYDYDAASRLTAITDALSRRTVYQYDAAGYLTTLIQAAETEEAAVTVLARDLRGQLTALTDPEGRTTRWLYDDFGNKVLELSPDRGIRLYRYDEAARLIGRVDESGVVTNYRYDAAGRLTHMSVGRQAASVRFEYQGTRLKRRSDPHETIEYHYDALARPIEAARTLLGRRYLTRYRYDPASGKLTEQVLPEGTRLHYRYDAGSGRLAALTAERGRREERLVDQIRYQPFGPPSAYRLGNGLTVRYRYDTAARLTALDNGLTTTRLRYDAASRLSVVEAGGLPTHYRFDRLDRLISAEGPAGTYAWAYDKAGNRVQQRVNAAAERYRYAPHAHRLLAIEGTSQALYRYDATGNPLYAGAVRYEYALGRPVAAYVGHTVIRYRYNSLGERIEKRRFDSGTRTWRVTRYLYEGGRLLAEANDNGDITRTYVYLGERALALLEGEQRYYLHTDYRHAPVAVSDATRTVRWQAVYAPFGWAQVNDDPDQDGKPFTLNLRLPGQYYDAETATHYNYQRDYDPKTGRYLTPDPLGVALAPTGVNPYGYVSNQPLTKVDVWGLYSIDVHYYMTYFLALVAGIDEKTAWTMALATQYIDDNRLTQPIRFGFLPNATALPLYHFVLDFDREFQGDTTNDPLTRFQNPSSVQLDLLRDAAMNFGPGTCAINRQSSAAVKAQLYGEYLHAFQDTFAHRNENNRPYTSTIVGHLSGWHSPDYTFNHNWLSYDPDTLEETVVKEWNYNELRTLRMEQEVFGKLQQDFGTVRTISKAGSPYDGRQVTWEMLESDRVLQRFNAYQDWGDEDKIRNKVAILNDWLTANGLPVIPKYDKAIKAIAAENRNTLLGGLPPLDGVLLP